MAGNPIWLVFLGVGLLILAALAVLAVLQRRVYSDQLRQVREILQEAKELAKEEGGLEPREGDEEKSSER